VASVAIGNAPAAGRLGDFVARSTWESIAPDLRHQGRRALLNAFAAALEACRDPAVEGAVEVLQPFSGPDRATLVGRRDRLDAMGAAFVNAVAANFLDFDDTHFATAIHPTAPVAPPVLALAELRGLSGAQVLHALILGMEVECRIGLAVSPTHYARGWHITSTCGVFGAAAACAKLLGLGPAATQEALAIAASQSAGVIENLPTAAKNVSVGNAARHGLFAALLAQAGYTAAPTAIEGVFGWARAMGDTADQERMLDGLGERWETAEIAFKPYPAGFVFHAEIDACLDLGARLGAQPDAIAEVVVRGDQLLLDRGERAVATKRDARVSIQHAAAIAFVRGRAGVEDFDDAAVSDPALAAFRARVRSELDPAMPTAGASVTVRLKDGRTETATVRDARGSPANPMSDTDLEAKFREGFRAAGLEADPAAAIGRIWAIDTQGTIKDLMEAMTPP
jgi:2-methylcitrate dehydratase PrpD